MHRLTAELNRAVFSKGFLAGAAGTVLALCIGAYGSFKQLFSAGAALAGGFHATALMAALTSDTMLMALPVLAALPGTAGFVEDWKSGYIKFCLPRQGRRGYIAAKAWASAISGALVVTMGILAAYVLFLLCFLPMEARPAPDAPPVAQELLGRAAMFALCGALWPLVGLAASTATLSTHMAYTSPFILYYVLVILVMRYFPGVAILNPQEWLRPAHTWPGGNWGVALLVAEMAAAAGLGFAAAARRRLAGE